MERLFNPFMMAVLPAGAVAEHGPSITFIWSKATMEAKVIIFVLAAFSIVAWGTMAHKAFQMRRARRLNRFFDAEFRQQSAVLGIFDRKTHKKTEKDRNAKKVKKQ